jgi:hypothetical protein
MTLCLMSEWGKRRVGDIREEREERRKEKFE